MDMLIRRAALRLPLLLGVALLLALPHVVYAQKRPPFMKEFLLQYKGKDILLVDKTGGVEQFVTGEASKAYSVMLNDVQNDYFVVSRDSDTDKRTFLYPLSIIRRIIYLYDGKPYQKIVLEMY